MLAEAIVGLLLGGERKPEWLTQERLAECQGLAKELGTERRLDDR
jgi:hypothetical protein